MAAFRMSCRLCLGMSVSTYLHGVRHLKQIFQQESDFERRQAFKKPLARLIGIFGDRPGKCFKLR
jgi:hypothetical protein